jgi:purine-binding chemotaxis protein CheW
MTNAPADYIVVLVDRGLHAISMASVREVTPVRVLTLVPGLPDCMRGVVAFEGKPTPVLDPSRFAGGPLLELSARSCLVFVTLQDGGSVAGVLIDDIVAVVSATLEPEPMDGDGARTPLIAPAQLILDGSRVAVMQFDTLLARGQEAAVAVCVSKGGLT